ncbi:MAG: OmpA family protein [Polyangiaceae bacterium]
MGGFKKWGPRLAIQVFAVVWAGCSPSAAPIPHYADVNRGADSDSDGIADVDDACPADAEDGLAPKANDGCPAPDPDGDGILYAEDKCPNAKEDGADPNPKDGCPLADGDTDGVADAKDKCPDKPEDNLAPEPNDGCPAVDGDKDGVADSIDKCPAAAEVRNGYRDEDGCADEVPEGGVAYDAESHTIWVADAQRIQFNPGTADLAAGADATVKKIADVLKAHPEISRLEIETHTTSKGEPTANAALSEKRSKTLASGLAASGVAKWKLVAMGYGEYCPAIDKGDEADEPQNERVVLKTVVVNGVWQNVARGCWKAKAAGIDPTRKAPEGPMPQGPTTHVGGD